MIYAITGVWFSTTPKHSRNISHVMMHEVADGMLLMGTKKEIASIVFLILSGVKVFTATWNYETTGWDLGSNVSIEHIGSNKYIRTLPNKIIVDNLDHLIQMNVFL